MRPESPRTDALRQKGCAPIPAGRRRSTGLFVLSSLAWLHAHAEAAGPPDAAQTVHFNEGLLRGGPTVDISSFDQGSQILAGQYLSDLYVNQVWTGRANVNLRAAGDDPKDVQPCFDRALLDLIGVDAGHLDPAADALLQNPAHCAVLPELVKGSVASFDPGEQRLDISLPQAAMRHSARDYVDPKLWDNGVTAARLGYNINLYRNDSSVYPSRQPDPIAHIRRWSLRFNRGNALRRLENLRN